MKKFIALLLVLTICVFSAFAYQNLYRLSSDEVQTFLLLRKASSSMTADPTYPVSAEQLSNLVKSLDSSKLNGKFKTMYDELIEKLDHPHVIFQRSGVGINQHVDVIGVHMYQVKDPDVYLPYKDRIPMAKLETDLYFGENFFGRAGLDPMKEYNQEEKDIITAKNAMEYGEGLPFLPVASLGYKNLNLTVGRDRLGAGNGYTGNLVLGENSVFDDFVKLSYVSDLMSYDFTYKRFQTKATDDFYESKNIFIHRFSANLFGAVNFSVSEGVLAAENFPLLGNRFSKAFDFDYLNPFMFMHNHFKFYSGAVNNFFAVEATAALPESWQISGQFFIDQLLFGGEDPSSSGEAASMVLLNASKVSQLGNGILDFYVEGAYGNPYVYLKNSNSYGVGGSHHYYSTKESYRQAKAYEAVDLVADYIVYSNSWQQDLQYLGYRYGGDLFTVATGAKYSIGKFDFDAKVQFIAKGNFGIRAGEYRLSEGRADYNYEQIENIVQKTLIAGLGVNCTVARGIEITASAAALANVNYHHQVSPIAFDYQYSLGVNIHVLDFFKIRKTL